jgi:glycosyltransferase involved in cell wall biosynthesis
VYTAKGLWRTIRAERPILMNSIPLLANFDMRSAGADAVLISVVTAVRNGERTLGRTIASVRLQTTQGLEYIIVDGASTDGTVNLIHANLDIVSTWKSEPDCGISDGFNKGIALASGKYVALLNADDWFSAGQIEYGVEALERSGADFVFGDLVYHDADGNTLYRVRGDREYAKSIARVMPALNHPTIIVRRSAYERHGLFDLRLRYAMDYEFLLRLHRAGCRGVYEPRIVGHMTLEGASDRNSAKALREGCEIAIRHGYPPLLATLQFRFRLLKGRMRRVMEKSLPAAISLPLRHLFNRSIVGPNKDERLHGN